MTIKYCRRPSKMVANVNQPLEITTTPCGEKISRENALNWCDDCRKSLPFWPAVVEAVDKTERVLQGVR